MANKFTKEGLENNYPAPVLADIIIKMQEENKTLKKEVKKSTAEKVLTLKKEIKELKKKNAQQEAFIKSIGETLKQYQHLIKKDGE